MRAFGFTLIVAMLVLGFGLMAYGLLLHDGGKKDEVAQIGAPGPLTSYYFEASIDVSPPTASSDGIPPEDRIRAWYLAPARWRQEVGFSNSKFADQTSTTVADGQTLTVFIGRSNSYLRQPLSPQAAEMGASFPAGLLLGRIQEETVDQFLSRWANGTWSMLREEEVLGRVVEVMQFKLDDKSRNDPTVVQWEPTLWIDKEYRFVLRYESKDSQQTVKARITRLLYNPAIGEDVFEFVPPEGSTELHPPTGAAP